MGQRACNSANISFGVIGVAVKFYAAVGADRVDFRTLTKKGNPIRQKWVDSVTEEEVVRNDTLKGYEFAKGQYVTFTAEELAELKAATDKMVDIKSFLPVDKFDLRFIEKTYYLGPDKGMDRQYLTFALALQKSGQCAIGYWASNGRKHPVMIKVEDGEDCPNLVMHTLYFANEVRSFENPCLNVEMDEEVIDLACRLMRKKSRKVFDTSGFVDNFSLDVAAAAEQKRAGKTVTVVAQKQLAPIADLKSSLREALAAAENLEEETPKPKKKVASKRR